MFLSKIVTVTNDALASLDQLPLDQILRSFLRFELGPSLSQEGKNKARVQEGCTVPLLFSCLKQGLGPRTVTDPILGKHSFWMPMARTVLVRQNHGSLPHITASIKVCMRERLWKETSSFSDRDLMGAGQFHMTFCLGITQL